MQNTENNEHFNIPLTFIFVDDRMEVLRAFKKPLFCCNFYNFFLFSLFIKQSRERRPHRSEKTKL